MPNNSIQLSDPLAGTCEERIAALEAELAQAKDLHLQHCAYGSDHCKDIGGPKTLSFKEELAQAKKDVEDYARESDGWHEKWLAVTKERDLLAQPGGEGRFVYWQHRAEQAESALKAMTKERDDWQEQQQVMTARFQKVKQERDTERAAAVDAEARARERVAVLERALAARPKLSPVEGAAIRWWRSWGSPNKYWPGEFVRADCVLARAVAVLVKARKGKR